LPVYHVKLLELDQLYIYPIVPIVRLIVNVIDFLLKCLVYRRGGKEGQLITIIGPTRK